jgi:hypothetical protein
MQDTSLPYKMPEFKSLLVEELDSSVIPLYKEYQNAVMMDELETMVSCNFSPEEITKHKENREHMHYRTSTWQYEIGFLGYVMGKEKVSDVMLGNVMAIQFYRFKEFNKTKNDYGDNPLQLFMEGFKVVYPTKERENATKKCLNALVEYGIGSDEIMHQLNITISE